MFQVIAEQDGVQEAEFKSRLRRDFEIFGTVERAYLVLVKHDLPPSPAPNGAVALCLKFRPGAAAGRTIAHCMAVFKEMFSTENALDVIPVDGATDEELHKTCRAFYNAR